MKVRALMNFACMEATLSVGQEANLSDEVAKDLVACGYVKSLEEKPTKKKAVKKDESE